MAVPGMLLGTHDIMEIAQSCSLPCRATVLRQARAGPGLRWWLHQVVACLQVRMLRSYWECGGLGM